MSSADAARRALLVGALLVVAAGLSGCGGSKSTAPPQTTVTAAPPPQPPPTTTSQTEPGALQAEANSEAAGDIPDNQVFLVFHNKAAGYSMKYPEGWAAQKGSGGHVTFRDKNNIVRIAVGPGAAATAASVRNEVAGLRGTTVQGAPQAITISGRPAIKVVYSTESAPNAVTGKRVKLVVDRYYLW